MTSKWFALAGILASTASPVLAQGPAATFDILGVVDARLILSDDTKSWE
jgi:hypothetical protein